jgi:hypothetical protein
MIFTMLPLPFAIIVPELMTVSPHGQRSAALNFNGRLQTDRAARHCQRSATANNMIGGHSAGRDNLCTAEADGCADSAAAREYDQPAAAANGQEKSGATGSDFQHAAGADCRATRRTARCDFLNPARRNVRTGDHAAAEHLERSTTRYDRTAGSAARSDDLRAAGKDRDPARVSEIELRAAGGDQAAKIDTAAADRLGATL